MKRFCKAEPFFVFHLGQNAHEQSKYAVYALLSAIQCVAHRRQTRNDAVCFAWAWAMRFWRIRPAPRPMRQKRIRPFAARFFQLETFGPNVLTENTRAVLSKVSPNFIPTLLFCPNDSLPVLNLLRICSQCASSLAIASAREIV